MKAGNVFSQLIIALGLLIVALTSQAAFTPYKIWGVFDDGGTLSGSFGLDLETTSITMRVMQTSLGSVLPGDNYIPWEDGNMGAFCPVDRGCAVTDFGLTSFDLFEIAISFADPLWTGNTSSLLIGGVFRSSERDLNPDGNIRYLVSGAASPIPEPSTFTLMSVALVSFGFARSCIMSR